MSKIQGKYRVMIIDIAEDKVVFDEFCDVVLGGCAKNSEDGKRCSDVKGIGAANCNLFAGMAACMAAEKIVQKHKNKLAKGILNDITGGDVDSVLDKFLEERMEEE